MAASPLRLGLDALDSGVTRIVSLLPAATEIAAALGLMEELVGVSHECDFPEEANARPRVTRCPIHHAGLTSGEVDEWVRRALRDNGTIYTIDEPLLRELRPDVILTQKRLRRWLWNGRAIGQDFARSAKGGES